MAKTPPVVLLAFADPRLSASPELDGLGDEQKGIRAALEPLGERVVLDTLFKADAETLFNAFRQKEITIFHYGGHSDDSSLQLNTPTGDDSQGFT